MGHEFVAERVLETTDENGARLVVHVHVARPEQVSKDEWRAAVHVPELDEAVRYAHGIDSLQALCMAYLQARAILERYEETTKRRVSWLGEADWRLGFPRFEPSMCGVAFLRHIEALVDAEVAQLSDRKFRERFKEKL